MKKVLILMFAVMSLCFCFITGCGKKEAISDAPAKEKTEEKESMKGLEAKEEDFEELVEVLSCFSFGAKGFEYDSANQDACEKILFEILGPFDVPLYRYVYNEEPIYVMASSGKFSEDPSAEQDPLNKFGQFYMYGKIPADELEWIMKNVFNVTLDREKVMYEEEIPDNPNIYYHSVYYHDDYYYFSAGEGGFLGNRTVITKQSVDENNVYTIVFDVLLNGDVETYQGTYATKCVLKEVEGKRQWTLLSMEATDRIQEEIEDDTISVTLNWPDTFRNLNFTLETVEEGASFERRDNKIFDSQGNVIAVIEGDSGCKTLIFKKVDIKCAVSIEDLNWNPSSGTMNPLSDAEATVEVKKGTESISSGELQLYRSYTGYWSGGVCNIENGEIKDYSPSWAKQDIPMP